MKTKFLILLILTLIVLLTAPFFGKTISKTGKFVFSISKFSDYSSAIIYNIRIPQTLIAFLIGFALSLCGLIYQTIFQNDLASPYTLGISSGTAFGAAIAIKLNLVINFYLFSTITVIAFISGFLTVFLLITLTSIKKTFDNYSLLLTGIALNFFFSAMILLTFYLSDFSETFRIHRWLMGTIDEINYDNIILLSIFVFIITIIAYYFREDLNLILLSDDIAKTRGLNIVQFKIIMLMITSILIAMIVSICGPIGFIGIVCPHIVKLIFGHNHKILIITSGLLGGFFLTICFTFSRIVTFPFIIPVGIITAFIGGPFLIYLLYRKKEI